MVGQQGDALHMLPTNYVFGERYGTLRNFITGMIERNYCCQIRDCGQPETL